MASTATTLSLLALAAIVQTCSSAAASCADIKKAYRDSKCCAASGTKATTFAVKTYAPPPPKLTCAQAGPQAPRDLTTAGRATSPMYGKKNSKAIVLTDTQAHKLPQTNIHFHYGAEHKSDAYNVGTDSAAFDAAGGRRAAKPRPGWMCSETGLTTAQKTAYTFQHCTGEMKVGKTYEVHYVHSSAAPGTDGSPQLSDGLGAAAGGGLLANPTVAVEAMVYQIVNDAAFDQANLTYGWDTVTHSNANSVMYPGSTTGTSYDNTYCSPYTISWHVDLRCHKVSAKSFDAMCKYMKDNYKMVADLAPHNSRKLLSENWVVPSSEVVWTV